MIDKKIKILDCTFRDGGYYCDWNFQDSIVEKYLLAISKAKVDIVEIGFRFMSESKYLGPFAYSKDDFLNTLSLPDGVNISVMINASELIDYAKNANDSILSIVIIESQEGLANLDEIVEVDGVDIIYFGAFDLSQDFGCPGEVKNPKVISAIQRGVEIVNRKGKCAGGFVPQSKDDVKWLLDMGMRFITYQVDSSIIYNHVSFITDWFEDQVSR